MSCCLSLSFSYTDSIYSVPDISMFDVNSYKCLLGQQCIYYIILTYYQVTPLPYDTLFLPPHSGLAQKRNILPRNTMRHTMEQQTRGKLVESDKKHRLKLWTRSLHVMMIPLIYACLFTWATIADLFSVAPIMQSPTHHSHSTYTQNPWYKAKNTKERSPFFLFRSTFLFIIYIIFYRQYHQHS